MILTAVEERIKASLIALLGAIKASDGDAVLREMGVLEETFRRDGASLAPQLAHFIERRSYAKALTFLGGEAPPSGTCAPAKAR